MKDGSMADYLMEMDAVAALNLAAAVIVTLVGASVLLYERFSRASRMLALVTTLLGVVLLSFGLAAGLAGPARSFWYRVALGGDSLLAPALYALALELVLVGRRPFVRIAWAAGAAMSIWALTTPMVERGALALRDGHYIAHGAWAGSLFVAFMLWLVGATIMVLIRSWRTAPHPDDRRRALTLAAGFGVGALSLADYFVILPAPLEFTPIALTAGVLLIALAAMRYRAFSHLPSFATERILEVMGDGVLLCDANGRIRTANRAAHGMLAYAEDELSGVQASRLIRDPLCPSASTPAAGPPCEFVDFLQHEVRDAELVVLRRDGELIDVSLSSEPLRKRGRIAGHVIVFRDISERIRAARALSSTEQRYHSLFWNNPALAYKMDLDGSILEVNPAVERMLGCSAAELVGRSFGEFVHPEDAARAFEILGRVVLGAAEEFRIRLLPHGGDVLEINGVSIPVFRDGSVAGVFGLALDMTEEERVRRELELQRLEFAELFEGSPEAMFVADENNVIVRVNPEFTRMFGYAPDAAAGRNADALLVPPELAAEGAAMTAASQRGEVVRAETVRRRSDGTLIDVSVLGRELRLPGRSPQVYGIYRDITEQRRAERSLRERGEELRHAQRLEAVGKLAGGIAHDFNNLVTVINGHAGFALEQLPAGHPARSDLEAVAHAGDRAANLTQQLLAFSRRQLLQPETVDAGAVIADVRRMLDRLIGEHIEFETSHDEAALVHADRGQLEQLLVNLVVNARDAMPDGGRLYIRTDRTLLPDAETAAHGWDANPGEYVRISVSDTGVGMDDATRCRAFDPFFTTKEHGRGTGLGLSTVFGIAKQSGGHVTIAKSVPGAGTTVCVWLPVAAAAAAAAPVSGPAAAGTDEREPPPRGRVLVVEDEPALRELVARVLRRRGHHVLLARDGVEALDIAGGQDLDVVVSDLVMPRLGGRELARQLRVSHPHLPVVLMSGYDDELAAGVPGDGILTKPFAPVDLARRVEQVLAGAVA